MSELRWPTYTPREVTLDAALEHPHGSCYVQDTAGNTYLDAIVGIGCLPLGHRHPKWTQAVQDQLSKTVVAAGTFWTEPQQRLLAELAARVPVANAKTFLGNTGTEVTEAAIKLALRATGRDVVIAFDRAFHGRSLGSISLTANPKYREPYVNNIGETMPRFATMNVARAPYGDLDAVAQLMREYGPRVAMVCAEPIQGEGGIHPASREFLLGLRELCDEHGAALGMDEIQSGCGRTGHFTAWETIVGREPGPDIVWFAKALGGGIPIAACVARGELAASMVKGSHGSTFGGNPLACAAAVATLEVFDDEGLLAKAAAQLPTLQRIAEEHAIPGVIAVRGLGAMIGIELGDRDRAAAINQQLQREGVLATLSGGTAIRWLFPYRAGEPELREAWDALRRALEKAG